MNHSPLRLVACIGLTFCVSACQPSVAETSAQSSSQAAVTPVAAEQEKTVQYTVADDFRIVPLPNSQADSNVVLLTFDDAPDQYSLEIATILKEKGVSAIFFVNGHFMDEAGKDLVKQIANMGFEIGNHTQTHPFLTDLNFSQQEEEIIATSDLVEEAIGQRPRFFRPPFGAYDDDTLTIVNQQNMFLMTWTYGYDWVEEYQEAGALTDITVNTSELSNGANILLHDRKWTKEAIADIVDGLIAKGYTIVDPATIQLPE